MGSLEMPSSGRKPPPRQVRTQEERARLGVAIASGLALLFVVILAYVFLTSSGAPTRRRDQLPAPPEAPRMAGSAATTAPQGELVGLKNSRLEFLDKDDPTRTAGRLVFQSMDPLEARNYAIDLPELWFFPKDGSSIRVRAQSARLYMPDRAKEPESGRLAGDVLVEVFQRASQGRPVDPEKDKPALTFRTRALNFDGVIGSVTTSDPFTINSEQADFSGVGLDILFNRSAQRLEMLQIAKGDALTIHPDRVRSGRREPRTPSAPAPGPGPAAPTGTPVAAPATDVHYRATFAQTVTLTQNERTIEADALTLWTRLTNGKLAPDAITPIRFSRAASPQAAPGRTTNPPPWLAAPDLGSPAWVPTATDPSALPIAFAPSPAIAPGAPAARTLADNPDAPIVLRWAGPCVVQPLDAPPEELARDQMALRFSADAGGSVRARDAARGAVLTASSLQYGATSRTLAIAGEPASEGVPARAATLELPGAGEASAARIEADLAHGLIHMPGPSTFTVAAREAGTATEDRPRLSCAEQADLTLDVVDGELTNTLKQATFAGDVRIVDRASSLTARFVRADFVRTPLRPAALTRLIAQGAADMRSDKEGSAGRLRGESIDIAFDAGASAVEPTSITAQREVKVERGSDRVGAGYLEATLARGPRGSTDVVAARALDGVTYANEAQNLAMTADELQADLASDASLPSGRRQVVELAGQKVTLARAQETSISGLRMRLDGVGPRIEVFGPGEFSHRSMSPGQGGTAGAVASEAHATWTTGMTFDDAAGVVTCDGEAVATASPDPRTRDRFQGEHVTITLAPREAGATAPAAGGEPLDRSRSEQRRVLSARARGSILDRADGTNAKVESRRYAASAGEGAAPALEQAVYLEGASISADHAQGTLEVPAAGRLLLRDARERPERTDGSASPDGRGDALFDWDGSMRYRRESGQLELTRNVRMTHRRLQDAIVTNLRCDRLVAGVNVGAPGQSGASEGKAQLTSVNATGSVSVSSGPPVTPGATPPPQRELSADMVEYDTARSVIAARANPGGHVSFIDTARGAPVNAASILWNLVDDRISVDSPQPVSAPR